MAKSKTLVFKNNRICFKFREKLYVFNKTPPYLEIKEHNNWPQKMSRE